MTKKRVDPLEATMEAALEPGRFISYGGSWSFVSELECVRDTLNALVDTGESVRAIDLYETFIADCYLKAEEVDDSGGYLGQFVEELLCDWIKARQVAESDPDETARHLLEWMDEDDYGFCYGLEKNAVGIFDRAGLSAFERLVCEQFAAEVAEDRQARGQRGPEEHPPFSLRKSAEILKTVYEAQGRADEYIGVCNDMDAMGLAPKDCERIAKLYRKRRKQQEALSWIEKGLKLKKGKRWRNESSYRLEEMKRDLLKKTGKGEDALKSAWESFQSVPSSYTYQELMKYVPKTDRAEWHAKSMAVVDGVVLYAFIDICVKTKEWDRLAQRILQSESEELESISHYTTESAAKRLTRTCPEAAAKVYAALGMRILDSGKSKYYNAALDHFASAKKLYEKAGRNEVWQQLVDRVCSEHGRKYSFMPGFELLWDQSY
jgi:tetratricopeptide (TPR) repeat protein